MGLGIGGRRGVLLGRGVALLSLALATMLPATAAADEPEAESFEEPLEKLLGGSLEMGVAARRELPPERLFDPNNPDASTGPTGPREVASLSPMLRLNLRVRDEVELYGAGGVVTVFTNGPEGQTNSARPSNITFGGRRLWEWSSDKYRSADLGVEFGIPTGYARSDDELDAYEYALAGRGGLGPWEWMPRTLSFVAPGGVAAQVFRRWVIDGRGAIAGMFPSLGDVDRPTIAAQISAGARFVLPWVALGVRASAVYNGRHPDDRSQLAITPTLDTSLCRRGTRRISGTMAPTTAQCPVYLSAKMNLNLDAPYGFVSDEAMGIWGLHFGLGWAVF